MTFCDEIKRTNKGTVRHGFGITDSKGRSVGALLIITTVEYAANGYTFERPGPFGHLGLEVEPGTYYVVQPWATRDGETFGATQPDRRFKTKAGRDAYVTEYLANAERRAKKAHTITGAPK